VDPAVENAKDSRLISEGRAFTSVKTVRTHFLNVVTHQSLTDVVLF
jgi:hypothetical protein